MGDEKFDLNLSSNNLIDVDVKYLIEMHWEKMMNLRELSLELDNNKIGNKGLLEIILIIDGLSSL